MTTPLGSSDQPETLTHAQRLRSIVGGSIGNLIEWYDWYVYAAFSLYFARAFFPAADQTSQLLNTAAVFAVGFLMRPLGAWLLGRYADRAGRKEALTASVLLMCAGSFIIAVTPTFSSIGAAAPALLITARLLQGLSVGGEYGASATYLSEMAASRWRGFYSSFQYVTLIFGQLLALSVLLLLQRVFLSEADLEAWGWRIPFAIGALLALFALYLRRRLHETPSFTAASASVTGVRALFAHPRQVLIVMGLTLGGTVAFYTYTTYMQKFLVNTAGWSKADATLLTSIALFIFMLLQPLVGLLSDRIGRRPLLLAFGIAGSVFTVPLMTRLSGETDFWHALGLIITALVIISGYTAINAIVKAELFPTHVRALGVALPYAITVSLFGGSAEYVALWLKSAGHEEWFFWYVSVCIGLSLLVYAFMPDTRRVSKIVD